ncbi:MAG: TetR/AcrR family transcriptional regulator [Verrucomicrobiota bacterium]
MTETRTKILETAVVLFAEKGYAGTSIRELTRAAGVNIAAINYHFGGKKELFQEMIRNRVEPMNRERIRLLDEAQSKSPEKPIPLAKIVSFMVRPFFTHVLKDGTNGFHFMKAVGKAFDDEPEMTRELQNGIQKEFFQRYGDAISRACGNPPHEKITYAFHFTIATVIGSLRHHARLKVLSRGEVDLDDRERIIQHLIAYINGGIRAVLKVK